MPSALDPYRAAMVLVLGLLVGGCAAPPGGPPNAPPSADRNQRLPTVPPLAGKLTVDPDEPRTPRENAVPSAASDRHAIQRGSALFHGKAHCVDCHGKPSQGTSRFDADEPTFTRSSIDLRTPSEKSVRQLYLIIKYGIPATSMPSILDIATFRNDDILVIIAYLLDLQGSPRPLDLIASQAARPHTETDMAVSKLCEQENLEKFDNKEHCEHRYAKRYLDLLIGRPPDIAVARYAEIETICRHVAYQDLDTLELCYRAEYTASRPPSQKPGNDQLPR